MARPPVLEVEAVPLAARIQAADLALAGAVKAVQSGVGARGQAEIRRAGVVATRLVEAAATRLVGAAATRLVEVAAMHRPEVVAVAQGEAEPVAVRRAAAEAAIPILVSVQEARQARMPARTA
jgi:hypothetical protein